MRPGAPLSLLLLVACSQAAAALTSIHSGARVTRGRGRALSVRLQADGDKDGSAFAAFAAFAAKKKEPKKGLGAPTRDASLPIRLGGTTRDGSLGDLRAAWAGLTSGKPLEAEEYGLFAVILSFIAGTAFFYSAYVADKAPEEVQIGPAQQALTRALDKCDDTACVQRVKSELMPAVYQENQLDDCLDKAFSGTERGLCKKKFGSGGFF